MAGTVLGNGKQGGNLVIMGDDILGYLRNEIYSRCKKPANKFGMGCWYHIEAVVKNGELLAQKYGADTEIVMIASWLHDIASVTDYALYENHHIYGAEMAYDLLTQLSYDKSKIPLIQACIKNHRGSICLDRNSVEELCVADADAISHFDSVPSLLYLVYAERKMTYEDGKRYVKEKLERSFRKLSAQSKEYYKSKYRQVMEILG